LSQTEGEFTGYQKLVVTSEHATTGTIELRTRKGTP
jgi:hypothetical protein